MIRICLFVVLIIFGVINTVEAQLAAYTNFQNQFIVWDNGMIRKIEYLVPSKIGIGRTAIAYIDNSRSFKIYHQGSSVKINDGFTRNFQTTDNLITFQNANSLLVWDKGEITTLSKYCEQFYTGDSLVLYFDGVQRQFNAYYNGEIYPIEGFLAASSTSDFFNTNEESNVSSDLEIAAGQLPSAKASDNIAAYVNYANQFKIFYNGEIIREDDYLVNNFDVGRNTVAYVDANQQFKIFHKGKTQIIDNFKPYTYSAGDDLVAFVGYDNYFKIFYNDSVYNIGYFEPEFIVRDNIVAYRDATGYFSVFYKGRIYQLESFYPDNFKVAYHSLAYVNRANVLRMFSEGNIYDVTNADIAEWDLYYDVLQYRFGGNMYKVFYKGKTY